MKFIYKGDSPIKDIDLVLAKIFKPDDVIVKGTVFEVPDDNKLLVQRVRLNGVYEEFVEPKKIVKPKKFKKDDDKDKED